jgi:hypothetical protein
MEGSQNGKQKCFVRWVNTIFQRSNKPTKSTIAKVTELSDSVIFMDLVKTLTGREPFFSQENLNSSKHFYINNCIMVLKEELKNLNKKKNEDVFTDSNLANEILNKDEAVTLKLLWLLICRYQIVASEYDQGTKADPKIKTLNWLNEFFNDASLSRGTFSLKKILDN